MSWDNLGKASCSHLDSQYGYPLPQCPLPKTEGWASADLDSLRWIIAIHPATTTHAENSEQSLLVKKSSIGKKLIDEFLKKNGNRKKCWEWEGYTNASLKFRLKQFLNDIPNGRAHFVGSARGDVSVEVNLKSSKIIAHFEVENVTSLTSLLYGVAPELRYPGPLGNWKQIYKWSIEYPCCLEDMPEEIRIQYEIEDILKNTFPYNISEHFQPTSVCLPIPF